MFSFLSCFGMKCAIVHASYRSFLLKILFIPKFFAKGMIMLYRSFLLIISYYRILFNAQCILLLLDRQYNFILGQTVFGWEAKICC